MHTFKQFLESRDDDLRKAVKDIEINMAKYGMPTPPEPDTPMDTDPDLLKWDADLLEFKPELAKWTHELLHKRKDPKQTAKEFKKSLEIRARGDKYSAERDARIKAARKVALPSLKDFIKEYKPKMHREEVYPGIRDGMDHYTVSTVKPVPYEMRQLLAKSQGNNYSFSDIPPRKNPTDDQSRHYYDITSPNMSV